MILRDRTRLYPGLGAELKEYVITRILQRFKDRESSHLGITLFNTVLFRELLGEACGDAARAHLIPEGGKSNTCAAFLLDDHFYGDVQEQAVLH